MSPQILKSRIIRDRNYENQPSLCSNRGDRRFLQYDTPRPLIRGCCL